LAAAPVGARRSAGQLMDGGEERRISPRQKLEVVRGLRDDPELKAVMMVGDGRSHRPRG